MPNERTSTENQLNRKLNALKVAIFKLTANRRYPELITAALDRAWKEEEDD